MTQIHQHFVIFGPSHLVVLAISLGLPLILAIPARGSAGRWLAPTVRAALAVAILGMWAYWYVLFWRNGWLAVGNALPLDLCSWASIAVAVALIRPNQYAYELTYFWALAGTLQGLITPDIEYDFPDARFLVFTIFHGGIIAAVLFMTFGMRMRPYAASLRRAFLWTLGYVVVAGSVDWLLDTNYGFLRAKPSHPSPYDLMPDWPYYLPVVFVLALVSMTILYAPFFFYDVLKRKRAGP